MSALRWSIEPVRKHFQTHVAHPAAAVASCAHSLLPASAPLSSSAPSSRDSLAPRPFALSPYQVHRDIKPGNILLNLAGTAKITDFGISTALDNTLAMCNTYKGARRCVCAADGALRGCGALAALRILPPPPRAEDEQISPQARSIADAASRSPPLQGRCAT